MRLLSRLSSFLGLRVVLTFACAILALYPPGTVMRAQTSDVTSSIAGTVHDSSGAAIPGAIVQAVARDTGFVRTGQTSTDGSFTPTPCSPLVNTT